VGFRLRTAQAEDAKRINELFCEMLRDVYGNTAPVGYGEGGLDRFFSGGEDMIYLADSEMGTVAFLSVEVHREQENYIYYDDFCVTAACRGRGIGSALMDEAEKYGRSIGINTVVLHVEKSNKSARRLYERRGFSLLREEETRLCLIKRQ